MEIIALQAHLHPRVGRYPGSQNTMSRYIDRYHPYGLQGQKWNSLQHRKFLKIAGAHDIRWFEPTRTSFGACSPPHGSDLVMKRRIHVLLRTVYEFGWKGGTAILDRPQPFWGTCRSPLRLAAPPCRARLDLVKGYTRKTLYMQPFSLFLF